MARARRILLVVDPAISDARVVRPWVRAIADRRPEEVYVIAPILTTRLAWAMNDDAGAIGEAEERLAEVLQQLYDRQVDAHGTVGEDDPILTSIGDALTGFAADEIIIAVHVDRERHWRERKLADKIRSRHGLPLVELRVGADGVATIHIA